MKNRWVSDILRLTVTLFLLSPLFAFGVLYPPGPGHALFFNGLSHVSATPTGAVSGTFTVEAWVNPYFTNESLEIVSCRTPSEFSFDMQLNPGSGLHGDIGDGAQWITTGADANFTCPTGQWLHVAYVINTTSY